jgi:hypothetical protein
MSVNKKLYYDPYKAFYDLFPPELEEGDEFEEADTLYDENNNIQENKENITKHIEEQIEESSKKKHKWVGEAMKHDPAFMLDPVNEYYKQLIPKELADELNNEDIERIVAMYDPVTWGQMYLRKKHGGWKPRVSRHGVPYQAQMIRCKSKRIVARAGRRIGKSISLVVRVLHKAFNFTPTEDQSQFKVVIFTPNQAQINTIFKMMEYLVDNNPELMSMVVERKFPTRKTPNYTLEFTNGVSITGYVSGSTAVRSSAANLLVLDEASFLEKEDTDAVVALLAENDAVELWVSSTPKGLKDYFYDRVHAKDFVSFYFPTDKFHPFWSRKMQMEFRDQLTDAGYRHEVLADFSADGEGVFQIDFVEACKADYRYDQQTPQPDWVYGIGVDWNDAANGTQIYVLGYNPVTMKFRIVGKESVHVEKWTQTTAVKKVREMVRKWRPLVVYTDYGHGATQNELLHEHGMKAMPGSAERILMKAKDINFSSSIEIRDPWTKKRVKKPAKAYLVNNAVRIVENASIELSMYDQTLIKQMEGYRIDRYTPSGVPVYEADQMAGDHALDAVMIALLGFNLEYSSLGKPILKESAGFVQAKTMFANNEARHISVIQADHDKRLAADKAYERQIYEEANAGHFTSRNNSSHLQRRARPIGVRSITRTSPRRRLI